MFHLIILAMAQASAPATPPPAVPMFRTEDVKDFVLAGFKKQSETAKALKGQTDEQVGSALTASVSGKTKLIFQPGHGVYAEYTAPDGQLRMWYPRNVKVVKGSWGLRTIKGRTRICFKYADAINPVTQLYEPTECVAPVQTLSEADVLRSWPGDVFDLMSGRLPYQKGALDMPAPELLPARTE
jgi:hypothetical protein